METATLTSPPHPVMVQPVQKSLSLPSYARSSGEGIDHKLIFAALEQREKVRRKSKIFKDKERSGSTRQNYFCLPLPSTNRCKETSLSSDTSCSSLEFQKPKNRSSPARSRKEVNNFTVLQNGVTHIEVEALKCRETSEEIELRMNKTCDDDRSHSPVTEVVSTNIVMSSLRAVSRSTVGSSDSMERADKSSKSSTDSMGRKERLDAIKARVEAEREKKLGESSSEEETSLRITRHNSDGIIHRTVREVKAKSSRSEKRIRRRAQEESFVARRATRKLHSTSLYLPSSNDLESWKTKPIVRSGSSFSLQRDLEEMSSEFLGPELKPIQRSQALKDSYFSDICNGNYRSHVVKSKVDAIEAGETKHREEANARCRLLSSTNNREIGFFIENKSYDSGVKQAVDTSEASRAFSSIKCDDSMLHDCPNLLLRKLRPFSPITKAPTPPPRSPKSLDFVNKVYIHHQNATGTNHLNEARSLERKKPLFQPNIAVNSTDCDRQALKSPTPVTKNTESVYKSVIASRRKTCTSFTHFDESSFVMSQTPTGCQQNNKIHSPLLPPRSPDLSQRLQPHDVGRKTKEHTSTSDISKFFQSPDSKQGKKWEVLEMNSEKKFNSLENNLPAMSKWKCLPRRKYCLCSSNLSREDCLLHHPPKETMQINADDIQKHNYNECNEKTALNDSTIASHSYPMYKGSPNPSERLTKSEVNISKRISSRTPSPNIDNITISNSKPMCDRKPELPFDSRRDATFSLDTAMEELENVYKSLRISTENLMENFDTEDKISNLSNLNSNSANPQSRSGKFGQGDTQGFDDLINWPHKQTQTSSEPASHHSTPPQSKDISNEHLIHEALCIDELFSDLTQQLDLEQKLLEESKTKKVPNSPSQRRAKEIKSPVQMSPRQQNSEQLRTAPCKDQFPAILKEPFTTYQTTANLEHLEKGLVLKSVQESSLMLKKKHKAVRSISENLVPLMQLNLDSDPLALNAEKDVKTFTRSNGDRVVINASPTPSRPLEQSLSQCRSKVIHYKPPNESSEVQNEISEHTKQAKAELDEIWQVRVSMGSGKSPEDTPMLAKDDDSIYKRLRSVLRRPSIDNNNMDAILNSERSSLAPRCPRRKPSAPLNENELEKMLTTLLSDVSKNALLDKTSMTSQKDSLLSKDTYENGNLKWLYNMESSSNNLPKNDKKKNEGNFLEGSAKLDNDIQQNNNEDGKFNNSTNSLVQTRRRNGTPPLHRDSEDQKRAHFNCPFVKNIQYPHPSQIPVRKNPRRHSVNFEECSSSLSLCSDPHKIESTQCFSNCGESESSLPVVSSIHNSSPRKLAVAANASPFHNRIWNKFSNQNNEVLCNTNEGKVELKLSQTTEKLKDKSFIRKSNLNRLEFVQTSHNAMDHMPICSARFPTNDLLSTSDANSDNPKSGLPTLSASSTTAKKSLNHVSNDLHDPGKDIKASMNYVGQKLRDGSTKFRHKRALFFKRKSHSAGEQETFTDHSSSKEGSRKSKLCFSAQEVDSQKDKLKRTYFDLRKKVMAPLRSSLKTPDSAMSQKISKADKTELQGLTNTCDNSSHCNSKANIILSSNGTSLASSSSIQDEKDASNVQLPSAEVSASNCISTSVGVENCIPLDQDLFTFRSSPPSKVFFNPFPTESSDLATSSAEAEETVQETEEKEDESSPFCEELDNVACDISGLEVSPISTDSASPSNALLAETEYARLPSSILRKKYDRQEIHGILKYSGDDKLLRNPPSILKHRESSEEKEYCSQTDLHSILKKSASEDEGCNGSGDIRPILKNTSTDEDSPSSFPKPILKKRTSFSEECSYAWFQGVDLKPILKKATINEASDDHPKPILKTRRKSEEAAAIATEFATSSRPRAYSADRGVRRKVHDANLT